MRLIPYLCVHDAAEAINFYKMALGATEPGARILDNSGRVGHATLEFAGNTVYLADEHPEIGVKSPNSYGGSPVNLSLDVDDVDAAFAQAVAAGGQAVQDPEDQFYGERTARIRDPYGFDWTLSKTVEELSDNELQERVKGSYSVERNSE